MRHKKVVFILILISLLFLIILYKTTYTEPFVVDEYKDENEYLETEKTEMFLDPTFQIGNYLSCYFHDMALAFSQGKNFETTSPSTDSKSFAKYLPTKVPLDRAVQASFLNAGITHKKLMDELNQIGGCYSAWDVLTKDRETLWTIMKPVANGILKEALKKAKLDRTIDAPVIHYRCSDVPMERNPYYHFQKYEYFKKALSTIKQKLGTMTNKVYICYCNTHIASENNQRVCDEYSKNLVSYLQSLGYTVMTKCDKIDEDFATLFYAPAVIGTGGSFSFMAGFFSDGLFYSSMYDETKDRELKDSNGWLLNGYTLKHSEVSDYYDTKTVINSLHLQ